MGFRAIERSTGICHNTVINWVTEASSRIPDENYEIPETAQLDELQTNICDVPRAKLWKSQRLLLAQKKPDLAQRLSPQATLGESSSFARATAVNSHQAGVLKWVIGDRSQATFGNLWSVVRGWECFLYITDGWKVYPCFINDCDRESLILPQLCCGANIVRC